MEAPTKKEVVDQMEWKHSYADSVTSKHRLVAEYWLEDERWKVVMEPWENGQFVNWNLELRSSSPVTGQCKNIEDAVSACGDAILKQINDHMAAKLREEEEQRKLSEYNQKGQEWADKANSVSIED